MRFSYSIPRRLIACGLPAALLAVLLASCSPASVGSSSAGSTASGGQSPVSEPISVEYGEEDTDTEYNKNNISTVTFNNQSIFIKGNGAVASGSTLTISAAGTYLLSGSLSDGQILIDAGKDDTVRLILNGVSIACSDSAALYAKQAGKTILTLSDGTENTFTDGETYTYASAAEDEPDAAVFCQDDLTINGGGTLIVNGRYRNGIASKDNLVVTGGDIRITAAHDALRGRDSLAVSSGTFTIDAGADGVKSNNDEDTEKGWISLDGGVFAITAGNDGIQAETVLQINGGDYTIHTGGGSANASTRTDGGAQPGWGRWGMTADASETTDTASAKGIKAGSALFISGGSLSIDSSDDSVHSNGDVAFTGGTLSLSSGDDGIHADNALTIQEGEIHIARSYEGLEGASVTVSGGTVRLKASDDGLNAAGGNDGSSLSGRPGQNSFASNADTFIEITGGYLYIDADGDGIDANGNLFIRGGTVLVCGPTDNGNSALDYDGVCEISGGTLAAAGSAGMAQAPGSSSPQNALMITYSSAQSAETLVSLAAEDGSVLLAFAPSKPYQSLILSLPSLTQGETYTLLSGGTGYGEGTDGYYPDGSSGGSALTEVTLSGAVTSISDSGQAVGGGMGGGPMGGGRGW